MLIPRSLRFAAGLVAVLGGIALSAQRPPAVIGILEDTPGHYTGDPHHRVVRVVFHRAGDGWSSCFDQACLTSASTLMDWTVSFDGTNIGSVTTRPPSSPSQSISAVMQQEIVGTVTPPTIGRPSKEFGGFAEEPVYRPLVVVSGPNYRDPDSWKPTSLDDAAAAAVRAGFRRRFSKVENCQSIDEGPKPWTYSDSDIKFEKTYGSKRGWLIAQVVLNESKCDGPPEEPFWIHWFVVTPERQIRFLDSNMWLVDAGDYDNDGRSELVFSIDGYNRGGYKLFYNDFARKAVFEFGYH